jgi:release factor glutamine methyltransferase
MVTVGQLLKEGTERLENVGVSTPRLDAEVLLYNLLDVERIYLHTYPEKEVSKETEESFWSGIEKREKFMPIQYIVNKQEFMGLDFDVEEGVLIPRGDTEILVEKVIDIYEKEFSPNSVKIMDIGTGSGAIVVSLAKFINNAILTAIDISPKALEIAKKNANANGVEKRITFHLGSLFNPIKGEDEYKTYDFIISNPPYIPRAVVETLDPWVKDYEPRLALDGGEDGLDFYREITITAKDYLKEEGWLLFEIGYDQGESVSALLNMNGFRDVKVLQDLAGLHRVVLGKK